MPRIYRAYNGAAPGASPMSIISTGAATTKTMLQLAPTTDIAITAWCIEGNGSAAATPGTVELLETTGAATVTALVLADILKSTEPANAATPPLTLGTTASGYGASAEGAPGTVRLLDMHLLAPTNEFFYQWPLDTEPVIRAGNFLRVRTNFGASISVLSWVEFKALS